MLYQSRYVPRLLSGWGLFASLLLALGSLATLYSPWFAANLSTIFMVPMFFYEVPLGLWFLVKGVKAPASQWWSVPNTTAFAVLVDVGSIP